MLEIKEATISKSRLAMEEGIRKPNEWTVIEGQKGVDFVGLLGVIEARIFFETSEGVEYGPLKYDLVSDAYVVDNHFQLCQLKGWLVGKKRADIEAFEGKKVSIIVDNERFPKKDTILAIGVEGTYLIPFWILVAGEADSRECDIEKRPQSAKMALEILARRLPIALEEI